MCSLERRRLRGDLVLSVSSSWGEQAEVLGASPHPLAVWGKLKLDIRLKLFTERTVRRWNRLSREVAPSPLLVKKCLDDSQLV